MVVVRVVTYNVRALRDDAAAVGRVLRELRPDVCCVQEAPRLLLWRWRNARLGRASGLVRVVGGGWTGGTALLVAPGTRVLAAAIRRLPRTGLLHRRALVWADVETGGVRLRAASIHLGLDAGERKRHLQVIMSVLPRSGQAVTVLAGDLNEAPGGAVWETLTAAYVDAAAQAAATGPTFPARSPRLRIDGVFVRGAAGVLSARVVDGPDVEAASDHRPVCVDLALSRG